MNPQLAKLNAWWAQRLPRERQMLLAMLAVLGIGLIWSGWSWTASERQRLAKILPATRAKLEAMRDDAAELQRLKRLPPKNSAAASALIEPIRSSAQARGLALDIRGNNEDLQMTGAVPFDALVQWLAEIHRDYGLRVTRLNAMRSGPNAQVDAVVSAAREG